MAQGKVSVTKEQYMQQTRREVESAVSVARSAPAPATTVSGTKALKPSDQQSGVKDSGDAVAEQLAGVSIQGPTIAAARPRRRYTAVSTTMCTLINDLPFLCLYSAAAKTVSYAEEDGSSEESHISRNGAGRSTVKQDGAGEGCDDSSSETAWSDSESEDSDSEESDLVPEGEDSSGSVGDGDGDAAADGDRGGKRGKEKGVGGTGGFHRSLAGHKESKATGGGSFCWNADMV